VRLRAIGVWKTYGETVANRGVDLTVRANTVHAVLGENGAGKSTLMKILYGVERPDEGLLVVDGTEVSFKSPRDALGHGVGMVFQHFGLVPGLTAAENIVLGVEPGRAIGVSRRRVAHNVRELMARYELSVDANERVGRMSAARQQRVEILKALYRGARILILDEPTALLAPQERASLFDAIRRLVSEGTTVLFITHKLAEVEQVADDLTVLRQGKVVGAGPVAELTRAQVVELMVGRSLPVEPRPRRVAGGGEVVAVESATILGSDGRDAVNDATFSLRQRELLALVGVEGNGQLEALEAIAGHRRLLRGSISIEGRVLKSASNRVARKLGVGYVPEDRVHAGVATGESILDNILANRIAFGDHVRRGLLDLDAMRRTADQLVEEFDVRCSSVRQLAGTLSGGNMQKLILGREISSRPRVLVVAEPTRGLDIASTALVHAQLIAASCTSAVIFVSSDLDEVRAIATRILVFYRGRIVAEFDDVGLVTNELIGRHMLGATEATA
jgi:general nucleoside transport system ATP-binding protein